jgi:hypothetical protein
MKFKQVECPQCHCSGLMVDNGNGPNVSIIHVGLIYYADISIKKWCVVKRADVKE